MPSVSLELIFLLDTLAGILLTKFNYNQFSKQVQYGVYFTMTMVMWKSNYGGYLVRGVPAYNQIHYINNSAKREQFLMAPSYYTLNVPRDAV